MTDINELDGTSILGRQDLRTGADGTLPVCGSDPNEAQCFDTELGIGRFPSVIGNSLLSTVALSGLEPGKLEAIKKNGTFQPLMKSDFSAANFICIKSGPAADDQDADETCSGEPGRGLLPGESQSVRLEMDYGDFRGLILRVAPGTLVDYMSPQDDPFGLLALRGDFDCRDQRRLPYCHPDLVGQDWFTLPITLTDVEFVTVHQPGDAASVMDFESNFGIILAMAGFIPTAEFWQGGTQIQVKGVYQNLPGGGTVTPPPPPPDPEPNEFPTAVISEPVCEYLTCTFNGSGSFDPDGSITDWAWRFFDGDSEVGEASGDVVEFTFLAAGTYTVQLLVTDNLGGTGAAETTVTVEAPPPAQQFTLSVTAFKFRGLQKAQLDWSGTAAAQIDIYRNGAIIATVNNTGQYIDNINGRGSGTYTYQVCEAGNGVCSNTAQAVFN